MKKREDIAAHFLYQLISTGILFGTVLLCFSDMTGISGANLKYLAALPVTVGLCFAVWMMDRRQRLYAVVIGIFVLAAQFFVLNMPDLSPGYGSSLPEKGAVAEWVRVFLINIICYLLQLLLQKKIVLKMALSVSAGIWLLYALFGEQTVSKTGVLLILSYMALSAAEYGRTRFKKLKTGDPHRFAIGIMPFVALYFLLLAYTPMHREPYDWQWAKNIYRSVGGTLTMYAENLLKGREEYFEETTGGFSEEGSLFSGITEHDSEMMTVKISGQRAVPVYLTGKIFNSFNGRTWESRGISGAPEEGLDAAETARALEAYQEVYEGERSGNFLKTCQMEVRYEYLHTVYLLAPLKTLEIEGTKSRIRYHKEGPDFQFDRKAGYGTEYLVRFYRIDMDREELYRFLEWDGQDQNPEAWKSAVKRYGGEGISAESMSADALDSYRQTIKELYLPETHISPQVEDWLMEITADAKTDAEKLKYIEEALSGMTYNTSPGDLPDTVTDGESYLDHFLLEKQEGYCVHYATAFVLLARVEGFPARYVQGFCVPAVGGEGTTVYSGMAHAWPEVYIEGKGWTAFEPSPGYGQNRYIPRAEDKAGGVAAFPTEYRNAQGQESAAAPADQAEEESDSEKQKQSRWLSYLGMTFFLLVIGGAFVFAADWMLERHREKKRSLDERYRLAVMRNLQILSMLGYGREMQETYHELAEKVRLGPAAQDQIPYSFIEAYENILYGTGEIREQIFKAALEDQERLLGALKKDKGKKYVLFRIRLYFTKYKNS